MILTERMDNLFDATSHTSWRFIRGVLMVLFFGATAIATGALGVGFLTHAVWYGSHVPLDGRGLSVFGFIGCALLMTVVTVVSVMAVAYVACLFVEGCREGHRGGRAR